MKATPHVKHWMPTRMAKFAKFQPILAQMSMLPNVVVRFSADDINAADARHGSMVVTEETIAAAHGATMCKAYENDGKCGSCRACWSKDVPLVAYKTHGQSMKKVIRLSLV
jgi:hypothetical protein